MKAEIIFYPMKHSYLCFSLASVLEDDSTDTFFGFSNFGNFLSLDML